MSKQVNINTLSIKHPGTRASAPNKTYETIASGSRFAVCQFVDALVNAHQNEAILCGAVEPVSHQDALKAVLSEANRRLLATVKSPCDLVPCVEVDKVKFRLSDSMVKLRDDLELMFDDNFKLTFKDESINTCYMVAKRMFAGIEVYIVHSVVGYNSTTKRVDDVVFTTLVEADSPTHHPNISQAVVNYILMYL